MGFRVGDNYRENELSLRPGGYTIVVIYHDWVSGPKILEYDKVKKPYNYINTVKKNPDVKDAYIKIK